MAFEILDLHECHWYDPVYIEHIKHDRRRHEADKFLAALYYHARVYGFLDDKVLMNDSENVQNDDTDI